MRIKYASKLSIFLLFIEVQLSIYLFLWWDIIKCLNASTAVFELVQQFFHATEIGNAANVVSACTDQR